MGGPHRLPAGRARRRRDRISPTFQRRRRHDRWHPMTARWLATFRLARRLVRRSPGRSVLIAVLVAVPVLAGTFAAVTVRPAYPSAAEAATRQLGNADAIVEATNFSRLDPTVSNLYRNASGDTTES